MKGINFNEVIEGHHTAKRFRTQDCDFGECTGFEIPELGLTVYIYDDDATRISFDRARTEDVIA